MRSNVLLAVAATLIVLLALEGVLRVIDAVTAADIFDISVRRVFHRPGAAIDVSDFIRPSADKELMYELLPGVRGMFLDTEIKVNAQGFRGPPVPQDPAPGTIRVVGLGDSIAFGWGVRDDDTFLAYIRKRFRDEHPSGLRLDVVNLGVPGYNTHQEVEAFVTRGISYHPDLVLLFLCDNDDELPNFVWKRDPYTLRRSYVWDLLAERLRRLTDAKLKTPLERTARTVQGTRPWRTNDAMLVPRSYRHMVGVEAVERALRRLAQFCQEQGIPVVYAGTGGELDERVRPLARELGFVVVDGIDHRVEQYLQQTGREIASLQVNPMDPHPNREYHTLIGASLYEEAVLPLALQRIGRKFLMPADVPATGGASRLRARGNASEPLGVEAARGAQSPGLAERVQPYPPHNSPAAPGHQAPQPSGK
jgi:lysophospholipase L1-like esterase